MIQKKQEAIINEHRLMLEGPDKEFIDFGEAMAPNSQLIKRKNLVGIAIEKETLGKKNNTVVLSMKDLIEEAKRYNLMIIPMEKYAGDFGNDYLKNVKTFMDERKLLVAEYDLKKQMFAVFPKKPFLSLNEENTDRYRDKYVYNGVDEKNPTVLFKDGDYFHLVNKGRNYKNLKNLRRGWLYSNVGTNVLTRLTSIIMCVVLCVSFACNHTIPFIPFWVYIIVVIVYIIYNLLHMIITEQERMI